MTDEEIAVENEIAIRRAKTSKTMRASMRREGFNPDNPDDIIRYDAMRTQRVMSALAGMEALTPDDLVARDGETQEQAYARHKANLAKLRVAFRDIARKSAENIKEIADIAAQLNQPIP